MEEIIKLRNEKLESRTKTENRILEIIRSGRTLDNFYKTELDVISHLSTQIKVLDELLENKNIIRSGKLNRILNDKD